VPAVSSVGPVAAAQRAVLQRFLEKNPDILVEPFAMPEIQGLGQDSTILMAIAAGVAPEAIYVNFRQSSTFVEKGFLAPLEILRARIPERVWPVVHRPPGGSGAGIVPTRRATTRGLPPLPRWLARRSRPRGRGGCRIHLGPFTGGGWPSAGQLDPPSGRGTAGGGVSRHCPPGEAAR
jgi:hypothetical protein